ncbi:MULTISPECIES: beta-ketoacyl-[acyl-carrier-protein] synthase family protein [Streptomyces]|uniref:Beta-ketoacyl-[acyl-carrier-protein] synthase family protein n=1 Tax=Streptomyces tsukubensis (strain DSM 42081 / NBRC 108919 / NRRL 18488 / 9993) TaxID=1114943 RepID=I2N8N4_STRT9|nr:MULTISPECIES: beta-ketoacyl-[acyl-carrier-protein] synthase family protein [Streptomyces]AZK97255.1 beta-ACP synthase [Streptomyces tsukubensis]EIF93381.1 3-oxoacyl-ACP synthase I [Streptomyces tsukubensis NRRL18488]MYS65767.1 beta-ketoacyl-ACP synthase II [Streptomyces sp. SID5473]QKM66779.1 beta-ketoacyl-[acyl-carrier-protein] synthase family protein [Streptomyces tsukubensis NRRL18488]TAI44874.1 beta-ketoacyl-[acyl-carrier-protein] synthase family protein [Streptomyces tsukubensis]
MTRRVAVTGVGVVAPGGVGAPAFWDLLANGRTATRGITLFDPAGFRSRIAAEVDFEPAAHGLSRKDTERQDRYIQFALVAAAEAIRDAGLDPDREDPWRTGVFLGSAVGGTTRLEHDYVAVSASGTRWGVDHRPAAPHLHRAFSPSTLASAVAEQCGAKGPVQTVSTGCTSGLDAVGYAFQAIEDGRADVVVAGASDSPISPITVACFDAIKATSPNNDDPEHASRPFDADRDGFVMGEGGAVLVLEELEHARARGATVYCEIGGYATFGNAYHMTGLTPEGLEMARAIDTALDHARIAGTAVDYVNAHGSGTKQNDRHETAAVKRSLGDHAYKTPMSSIKSMVGHSLGAIGAIELVACVLAMDRQVVPPTANYNTPDPECDLDYVPRTARPRKLRTVLSVGSGFGGFQSAVVMTRPGSRTSGRT